MRSVANITTGTIHSLIGKIRTGKRTRQRLLEDLDLTPIKFKLIKESGWTPEKADRVEKLYRGYLRLVLEWPGEMHVPTEEIDEMWHAHILDTYKYMDDCRRIFGYYLHHFPYLGLRGAEDEKRAALQFEQTRGRFLSVTGIDLADAADCGGGCGGGSCGSSCGGGGGGGGTDPTPASCTPAIIPATCTSSPSRKDDPPRRKQDEPEPEKPSIWRLIVPGLHLSAWEKSINPAYLGVRNQKRPGAVELQKLAEESKTLH